MKRLLFLMVVALSLPVYSADTMQELLQQIEAGRLQEASENKAREREFLANKNKQAQLLAELEAERKKQEALSAKLEQQYEENDAALTEVEARFRERMGSLSELLGHLTSAMGDARANFATSLTSTEYPERDQFLEQLIELTSSGTDLPAITQIERVREILLSEMIEQGRIVKYTAQVAGESGEQSATDVVRFGVFNVVDTQGQYLALYGDHFQRLKRQPGGDLVSSMQTFQTGGAEMQLLGLDPTGPSGGSLMSALIDMPTLEDKVKQGGIVGAAIIGLGAFAFILAIWRLVVLLGVASKVKKQLADKAVSESNPLGRVMKAAMEYQGANLESMELKLNEAILKELPKLQTGEALLKIIAAVAPLMGLLGTVTGMILTFQAITVFGTDDPTAMAGGISAALVTTVLGLIVAIPVIILHTIVSSRSRFIIHVLEEQAAGLIAKHQEA